LAGVNIKDVKEQAADAGTLAHEMVEAHLTGGNPLDAVVGKDAAVVDQASKGYSNYLAWERQTSLKVVSWEQTLVSELYRYGGTPDAIVEIDGKLSLADWKSSNAVYSDYLLQISAYHQLWSENFPDKPLHGSHLLRFSKDYGDFVHYYFDDLDDAWKMFQLLRQAYELDKALKKRVK